MEAVKKKTRRIPIKMYFSLSGLSILPIPRTPRHGHKVVHPPRNPVSTGEEVELKAMPFKVSSPDYSKIRGSLTRYDYSLMSVLVNGEKFLRNY